MLQQPLVTVMFQDRTVLMIDPHERYSDELVDSCLTAALDGKKTTNNIPIVTTSSISFYVIKDASKASRQGLEQKQMSDQMAHIMIEGAVANHKTPFLMATTIHGGGHYQGLTLLFKAGKHVDVTAISSINKLNKMSMKDACEQLRAELTILGDLGYTIDNLQYKEHFLQEDNNDCGPCTIANMEYECLNQGEAKPTRLSRQESIILRANHAYQFKHKKVPPPIVSIDGSPLTNPSPLSKKSKEVLTQKQTKPLSLEQELIENCQAFFNATPKQAEQLASLTMNKQNRSLEDHMGYLAAEIANSEDKIDKAIARLSSSAPKKLNKK